MRSQTTREAVRVLFHLNGYTKVMVESTEGVGSADGGVVWELPTDRIPLPLRKIGSRFVVEYTPPGPEEMNDPGTIHEAKDKFEVCELDGT